MPLKLSSMVLLVGLAAAAATGCASASSGRRPAAFPGAPVPLPEPVPVATRVSEPASPGDVAPVPAALAGDVSSSVVRTALALEGIAYRFGGEDPSSGLDCSGLVHYVFARHRVIMPRTVEEQFDVGESIDLSEIAAGDLVFFTTIGPGATHVGVALGPDRPGEFVHAPGTGSYVRVDRWDSAYWQRRIVGVRRVLRTQ